MPDTTPILSLPLILPAQAQKHVTHNEALLLLDVLAQLVVLDRSRTAPPVSAVEGDVHIVAASATGDWAGQSGAIATWWQGIWTFIPPRQGWRAWDLDQDQEVVFDGGQWLDASARALRVARLGVNADADTTNRLSVSAPATLLNHEGAGHQLKLNKSAPGETASLLFQTAFSGRAEMGLAGEDDFSVKVSPNGGTWTTALSVNRTTGAVGLPSGAVVTGQLSGTAVTQSATDATAGRLLKAGDFGIGGNAPLLPGNNLNATFPGGLYIIDAATANAPGPAQPGCVLVMSRSLAGSAAPAQFHIVAKHAAGTLPRFWIRVVMSNLFGSWQEICSQSSLLGAVSQSGGLPTGAVIERGSNANGEFVRFADGTQICTRSNLSAANASTALGSMFRSADVAWTFPATFAVAPVVSGAVDNADCWLSTVVAPSATTVSLRALAAVTKGSAMTVRAQAIGRWF